MSDLWGSFTAAGHTGLRHPRPLVSKLFYTTNPKSALPCCMVSRMVVKCYSLIPSLSSSHNASFSLVWCVSHPLMCKCEKKTKIKNNVRYFHINASEKPLNKSSKPFSHIKRLFPNGAASITSFYWHIEVLWKCSDCNRICEDTLLDSFYIFLKLLALKNCWIYL